ncbi:UNKNOWN [Stylonychia lemnae]|uniref:Uncharacterized protein n=1 Tax=Stylonychia lemnae TaxID=5949 RepID=A0A078AL98_STYLE|nr:UNKNOWN [Stylonychia lemnae]|eukprot:CDW82651.1 UNKNOWN [Stylonychia lemnae]
MLHILQRALPIEQEYKFQSYLEQRIEYYQQHKKEMDEENMYIIIEPAQTKTFDKMNSLSQ